MDYYTSSPLRYARGKSAKDCCASGSSVRHGIVSADSYRISTFSRAPARPYRKEPVQPASRSYSIYPIPSLTSIKPYPFTTSCTSMRDGDRSHTDASRESSEHSHRIPSARRSPGRSCYTSGIIVENTPDIPGPKPNITHSGRVSYEHESVR